MDPHMDERQRRERELDALEPPGEPESAPEPVPDM
jgi:hypothetical protein